MANSNGWGDGAANNSIGWGQGANNSIGWGSSHLTSWAGATDIVGLTTDADAQAFITAAAITDATQKIAINNLVVGMKADGIWTKMKAIYPFVGGTATTHKWNLKDPRDLDAAFRLVFNGGWTHSSNGALPNGTNGYADTKLNENTVMTLNNMHIAVYLRTNKDALMCDIGLASGTVETNIFPRLTNLFYARMTDDGLGLPIANSDSRGFFVSNRVNSTQVKAIKNNTISTIARNSISKTNLTYYIGAFRGATAATFFSDRQCAFSTIGDGLTDTEASNLYTRVQAFQTSLSRQV